MAMHTKPHLIPFPCPACTGQSGVPIGLAMQGTNTVVAVLRCKTCAHMWQVQRRQGQTWPVENSTESTGKLPRLIRASSRE